VVRTVPALRARILAYGPQGAMTRVSTLDPENLPDGAWALRGERGVTYQADLPRGNEVVRGKWWPRDWEGEPLVIRPIRPEDEPQHRAFIESLSPGDLRLRFFSSRRDLPRSEIARLTQIDYAREMAFIARIAFCTKAISSAVSASVRSSSSATRRYGTTMRCPGLYG
jgi:hypothetical protein